MWSDKSLIQGRFVMNTPEISFIEWQRRFSTETDCINHIKELRWPDGFRCPRCGHNEASLISTRHLFECLQCHKQTSAISNTLFHGTHIPLVKWFAAIYFISSDKGSISALRLKKLIEVNWRTARLVLGKITFCNGTQEQLVSAIGFN